MERSFSGAVLRVLERLPFAWGPRTVTVPIGGSRYTLHRIPWGIFFAAHPSAFPVAGMVRLIGAPLILSAAAGDETMRKIGRHLNPKNDVEFDRVVDIVEVLGRLWGPPGWARAFAGAAQRRDKGR